MIIKEVVLQTETQRIADFLKQFGLRYEKSVDQTIYMEDNGEIIATLSASKHILKCLAVRDDYRNGNLAGTLVSEMIKRLHSNGITYYQVFTKPEHRAVFLNLGFSPLLETQNVAVLEGGDGNIKTALNRMKVQMKFNLGLENSGAHDIACVVINGNPFTNGHLKLIEYVSSKHRYVIVFVLEEEGEGFTFKERYAMAYLALKPYYRVLVLPSSKYVVSKATFPSYFLKTVDDSTGEYAKYDAMLFEKYFMPELGISKRYVGSETTDYMKIYNNTLKEVLKNKIEIVPRFRDGGEIISASKVRSLIKEGKTDEAMKFIPRNNYAVFKGMIISKDE